MVDGAGLLLLSAAAGYWVLERAENHKRGLRRVGRWVGGLIVVAALAGVACRVTACMSKGCAMTGKGAYCPIKDRLLPPGHPALDTSSDVKPLP